MVPFTTAIRQYFSNYAVFSGRATRAQFWWPQLFNFIVRFAIELGVYVCFGLFESSRTISTLIYIIAGFYSLLVLLPSLSVLVRRLHDIGKGGGWIFIACVPAIGSIWLLVLLLMPGQPFPNRFGPEPDADPDPDAPTPPPFRGY